jgi:DNA-binding SARP family transcriptional activator
VGAVRVNVQLLGGFQVWVDGRPVPPDRWTRRHTAALVKLLALTPAPHLHREQVIDALWPHLSVTQAAPRLHKAAHYARKALGSRDALVLAGDSVRLCPTHDVRVDALDFQRSAGTAIADGGAAAAKATLARYGGALLPLDVYEAWTEQPRRQLAALYRELLRQAGDWHQLLAADPTDEQAHVALARRHAERGDRSAALRQLDQLESVMQVELGLGLSAPALALRAHLAAAGTSAASLAKLELALDCAGIDRTSVGAEAVADRPDAATMPSSCCG